MNYRCLPTQFLEDATGYSLVPLRVEDMELIRRWRNAQMNILRQNTPISEQEQERYFKEVIAPTFTQEKPSQLLFSYLLKGQLIGYGGLTNIDWSNQRAELTFLLNPVFTEESEPFKQGFLHFLKLICRLLFSVLQMNRFFAEVYAFRTSLIAQMEDFGFQLEGKLRSHVFKNNQYIDSLIYGLLKKDYKD